VTGQAELLHVVEPTLTGEAGHQLSFSESVWLAAQGGPVKVWASRAARLPGTPPWVTVERHFYRALRRLQAPLLYRRLLGQPGRILVATAARLDLIWLDWAAGRRPIPPGKVNLYFHWFRDSASKRRTIERVARRHPGLVVLGPTPSVVEIFRACGVQRAEVAPYPITPPRAGAPPAEVPFSHLLFAGAARQDKGFGRLVDLVEHLARLGERLPVAFQRAPSPDRYEEATRRDLGRLDRLGYPALRTEAEPLPAAAYAALYQGAICIQPYDQVDFADRVSGVTLDALTAGCPVVALQGTWTARAVARFGAGQVVADARPETLLAAVRQVVERYPEYRAAALRGGAALQEENDGRRLYAALMAERR
jgi:glycosyltransferase involved in cell wall biosynthesis